MNDEELNELIARRKSETTIFHEMNMQREKDALETWRAQGKVLVHVVGNVLY